MERETGIEPAPSAWKAEVLPLNYSRLVETQPIAEIVWWREVDSNHRRRKPADLQSAPVGRLGIPPTKNGYCVDRGLVCQHLDDPKQPDFRDFQTLRATPFSRFPHHAYRPTAPCSWKARADAAPSAAGDAHCHHVAPKTAPVWVCHQVCPAQRRPSRN
jgi:hypothetical protein